MRNPPEVIRLVRVRRMLEDGSAKALRVDSGLSLRDVADALGVNTATVHRWEANRRIPHRDAALRYADLLDALTAERVSA